MNIFSATDNVQPHDYITKTLHNTPLSKLAALKGDFHSNFYKILRSARIDFLMMSSVFVFLIPIFGEGE